MTSLHSHQRPSHPPPPFCSSSPSYPSHLSPLHTPSTKSSQPEEQKYLSRETTVAHSIPLWLVCYPSLLLLPHPSQGRRRRRRGEKGEGGRNEGAGGGWKGEGKEGDWKNHQFAPSSSFFLLGRRTFQVVFLVLFKKKKKHSRGKSRIYVSQEVRRSGGQEVRESCS